MYSTEVNMRRKYHQCLIVIKSEKAVYTVSHTLLHCQYLRLLVCTATYYTNKIKNMTLLTQFKNITALSLTILSNISNSDLGTDGLRSLRGAGSWCTWQVAGVDPDMQKLRVACGLCRLLQVGWWVTPSAPVLIVWWSARLLSALQDQTAPSGHSWLWRSHLSAFCHPSVPSEESRTNQVATGITIGPSRFRYWLYSLFLYGHTLLCKVQAFLEKLFSIYISIHPSIYILI